MLNKYLFFWTTFFSILLISCVSFGGESLNVILSSTSGLQNLDWKGWFTVVVFFMTFTSLVLEILPPDATMLLSASILTITGIISPTEFLSGFSKDVIFTIAMLLIIVRALEVNGILKVSAKWVLPEVKNHYTQMGALLAPMSIASSFLNNTPIVLVMTSLVKSWAIKKKRFPSKYLIPISFAAILGGMCTLIGTSTNIIIDGLLRSTHAEAKLEFFELSYIGVPFVLAGLTYLIFFGYRLLPERIDPSMDLSEHTEDFSGEFVVEEGCPLANQTIKELSRKYFHGTLIAEIERLGHTYEAPSQEEYLLVGDRLVFLGDINEIAQLHEIEGLRSLADPHFQLDVGSSHYSEVVISTTSSLIGKTLKNTNFRSIYGASVIAVYRQGRRIKRNVREIILQAGDSLMLLSSEAWSIKQYHTNDFYVIRSNEKLVTYNPLQGWIVITSLIGVILAATLGYSMMLASMCAVIVCVFTKAITLKEAQKSILWNLIILIASSFAIGLALRKTGVAHAFGEMLVTVLGTEPHFLIAGIFIFTVIFTEVITNNAAALIVFPIAIETAQLAGYGSISAIKAIGITVTAAASCSFLTPIGYQTNTIVYGPGGYRFTDYFKIGAPLTLIIFFLAVFLIPYFWPLV